MAGEKEEQIFRPINLREVVAGKNKKLARQLPKFIYKWLESVVHLKEVNDFLKHSGHLQGLDFANKIIEHLNIQYSIKGLENIPKSGRYIFVSNHPLGGLDGVLLLKQITENFGYTRSLTNDFLMAVTPFKDWFVPINKVGGQGREALQAIDELYTSDDQILIFPAGLCSRKINGEIVDLEWQKHFIQKAVQYKIDVVPIYFEGRNSNKFYNLAKFRKLFRIKFNIEMMYLVDELFKHKDKTFSIHFGKPLSYESFNSSKKPIDWAQKVKSDVYSLKENLDTLL